MLSIDFSDVKKLEKDLKRFASRIYPQATGATLNRAAAETRLVAQKAIRRKFITRNKWSAGSVRYDRAKGFNPMTQEAVVGSVAPYMADQEFGTTINKTGKHGVDIPTRAASGEGRGSSPRRRVVRRPMRRGNIRINNTRVKARSKKQYIVASIKQAAKRGGRNKFLYLPFSKHPGIYRVVGGKRKPRIEQIHDFSKQSVYIQPRPWLRPSAQQVARRMPRFFKEASERLLRRKGLI